MIENQSIAINVTMGNVTGQEIEKHTSDSYREQARTIIEEHLNQNENNSESDFIINQYLNGSANWDDLCSHLVPRSMQSLPRPRKWPLMLNRREKKYKES